MEPENEQRRKEMIELRFEKMLSLQEIGNLYGLTRERVRQIIGNTGYGFGEGHRNKQFILSYPERTNRELASVLGLSIEKVCRVRKNTVYQIDERSSVGRGQAATRMAQSLLETEGFKTELQPKGTPYNLLVDGRCRIRVCSANHPVDPPSRKATKRSPLYQFNTTRVTGADFCLFIITSTQDVFIVPTARVSGASSVIFAWKPIHWHKRGYQQYHNRYDLIREWLNKGE